MGQQIHICARQVVNQVQIGHLHAFWVHREGVGAVLGGLEAQRHFTLAVAVGDGIVLVALRDIDIGILMAEVELAQFRAFVETDDGVVEGGLLRRSSSQ